MNALSDILRARIPDLPLSALSDFASQAGVSPKLVSLARAGKPINAGAYLAVCGAVGVDPVDGKPRPVKQLRPSLVWWQLSAALYITRALKTLDQRAAAKVIGVSSATVCRLERSQPVSIGVLIKICAFIGVHPDGYTAPLVCPPEIVPRETRTETSCIRSEKTSDLAEADQAAAP